ncbi:prepilin-type N-terminal cleavage/methylation domain-containing protein [Bacillus sp. DTU_2020_1000418_1_SI_GHA_SEK_038]|uniref:prepilin-type N-terminal cleavage/methylation domain-containing protein n=1 Tax=Bacillus sp. DTU_2020_1000418_1_SI_GHA_SEK_038 TaxID=3077585 RepID=UPI0028E710F4|nr:prepilin-type N-terminal cleavage/methylation domain-containing protein [Bacillus sp. DTU_2020_1000418_1_SI_GHA_SEK_038]WNS74471.1 prepilin-type N-terminal cleavage/methylation domain-containing protein [Bacillus sp. DTU_2020_1000418_1_SI_GHA_SEK_038]
MHCDNQKGLTLVEVLLSIVILTIILGTIIKFFPQMGMMNKQNEIKQEAVNIAKEILIDWQNKGDDLKKFLTNPSSNVLPGYSHNDDKYFYFNETKGNLNIEVKIRKKPDLDGYPSKAYLVHIKLKNNQGKKISETYGYIIVI